MRRMRIVTLKISIDDRSNGKIINKYDALYELFLLLSVN